MKKISVVLGLILCLNFFGCPNQKNSTSSDGQKKLGKKAPEIKIEAIYNKADNKIPTLKSLRGKVVVLDFWAIWCSPCVASFPENNDLSNKFKNKGVQFIGITDDPKEKLENFLKKVQVDFWIGRDHGKQTFEKYNIDGRPTVIILNKDGDIVYTGHSVTEELLNEVIATNTIVEEKKVEKNMEVIASGGFSPGDDPLYNGVLKMQGGDYPEDNPQVHSFIIRKTLNTKYTGGYGWRSTDTHVGVTFDAVTLEKIFQTLYDLRSSIRITNKTKDTTLYDIVYWKKGDSIDKAFTEIQEKLFDGLSLKLISSKDVMSVSKLSLPQKNENVVTEDQIEDGAYKAYTSIDRFLSLLEESSKGFFSIDQSLENTYILNKGMEYAKQYKATATELLSFLKNNGITVTKVKDTVETFSIDRK